MFDWQHEAERLVTQLGSERIRDAVNTLSNAYREGRNTRAARLDDEALIAAYLSVRFPATRAANLSVAKAIVQTLASRLPDSQWTPASLLDLGAGCGAGALAFSEIWPGLARITALERLPAMVELGKQILPEATWQTGNFDTPATFAPHDVVLLSYSLGESDKFPLAAAWQAATQLLVIVEAGTPKGFETILRARKELLSAGASLLAPCPADEKCPAAGVDWCHFSARLNRSALHRRLKGGTLGYEDEKFSYLAAWRGALPVGAPRIIRHPVTHPGRIDLELCEAPARGVLTVTKRYPKLFKIARKLDWGDGYILEKNSGGS
ncbi:small ribosomal subunit Rsm22 family protein [Bryobacter aggregatus]|uniref:small ribosomal subunit Rsm22 family protein n=1 Tax=Bryobacter aggregatus TaxID=360054 RepID=UPI00056AB4F2|nr:small ribosomal subunit Rsm22 family protein [Bryobacter aggregatus]